MCGCFLIGMFFPRIALVLMWLFTDVIGRAFPNLVVPILGIIFLPMTTLLYALVFWWQGGVYGLWWIAVVIGLLIDLGSYGAGGRSRTRA